MYACECVCEIHRTLLISIYTISQYTTHTRSVFPDSLFQKIISINLTGSFHFMKYAAMAMSTQPEKGSYGRGVLVNTASVAAFDGTYIHTYYLMCLCTYMINMRSHVHTYPHFLSRSQARRGKSHTAHPRALWWQWRCPWHATSPATTSESTPLPQVCIVGSVVYSPFFIPFSLFLLLPPLCCSLNVYTGIFGTPLMLALNENAKESLLKDVVAPRRYGFPDEFALCVTSILDNQYMNAACVRLDGGIRMSNL
jgi:hypothetical protein